MGARPPLSYFALTSAAGYSSPARWLRTIAISRSVVAATSRRPTRMLAFCHYIM